MTIINYFNTNNLLIDTPIGQQYGGVSAWQGIRYLGSDTYLICGTTNPNPNTGYGLIYIGNINCNDGIFYYLNVPNSLGTSVYGPNYNLQNGIYTFVGSYTDYNLNIKGFVYNGTLDKDSLTNPSNFLYPNENNNYDTTFLHSNNNGLIVGNSGNSEKIDSISYIYDINDMSQYKKKIKYPGSLTTTTYGIWYNGNNKYTLVGGYSTDLIDIKKIYSSNFITPIGNAFIVDYDFTLNIFSNWTSIAFNDGRDSFITHFQGISQNENGSYSINANVVNLSNSLISQGYFLTISRDNNNNFLYNSSNWIELNYNNIGSSSSNSVANNKVIGLHISKNNISYQAEIINQIQISKYNLLLDTVKDNEIVLFNNTFLDNNLLNYNKGVIKFLENGNYFINFNIYIENTKLPAIIFKIEYTLNGIKHHFNVAQKGIDEIGTGTAHSLVIPCSFINKFNINDTLKIINKSGGTVTLISNYTQDAINAIISITKLS
jgi:hypothetical protein